VRRFGAELVQTPVYQKKGIDPKSTIPIAVDEDGLGLDLEEKRIDDSDFSPTRGKELTLRNAVRGVVMLINKKIVENKNDKENLVRIASIDNIESFKVEGGFYLGIEVGGKASREDQLEKQWICRVLNKLVEKEYIYQWVYRGDSHVIQV
jgi:hypothetical protein